MSNAYLTTKSDKIKRMTDRDSLFNALSTTILNHDMLQRHISLLVEVNHYCPNSLSRRIEDIQVAGWAN